MLSLFIEWTANPEIFPEGGFFSRLRWYGLCWAMGFYIGFYMVKYFYKVEGKKQELLDPLFLYIFAGGILGARIGHCLFYDTEIYLRAPWEMLKIWEGGLASHGGLIGVVLAIFFYCKKYKQNFLDITDRVSIAGAFAAMLIRIGNLFNHEIIGDVCDKPWCFQFTRAHRGLSEASRHPTQLYESIIYFFVFIILLFLWKKYKGDIKRGLLTGTFFVLVFSGRFIVEFVKIKQAHHDILDGTGLKMGQLLSIPVILAGLYILFFVKDKKINTTNG